MQVFSLGCLESTCVDVDNRLARRLKKYTSPEVQNKCLRLMVLRILHNKIAASSQFSTLDNDYTDCFNKEQFIVSIRWIDEELKNQKSFIGFYLVDCIDAISLLV